MPGAEDRVPFIPSWRTRAKEFNRRPILVRQLLFLGIFFLIAIPILLLSFNKEERVPLPDTWQAETSSPPIGHYNDLPKHVTHPTHISEPHNVGLDVTSGTPTSGKPDPMTFALIMWGEDSAAEGAILLKSILMYTSGPVDFHIICDDQAQLYLEKRLRLVKRPRYDVFVRFYRPTWQAMLERIQREGTISSVHAAGTPGLMKLFIHEILPSSVKKAVFVDTDAFFISDPYLLWEHFLHTLPSSTIISMPTHPEMFAPQWFDANKICSCIMLMDLEALRRLRLMDSSAYRAATPSPLPAYSPPAFRALFGAPDGHTGKYENIALGDQSYWWAIIQYMESTAPESKMFQHLHYDWEISSCLADMYITNLEPGKDDASDTDELGVQIHTWATPHQGEVIRPKPHCSNCLPGPRYYEWPGWEAAVDDHTAGTEGLARRWGTAIKYHVGYKWLWLARGAEYPSAEAAKSSKPKNGGPNVTIETVQNVKFADELFAETTGPRDV